MDLIPVRIPKLIQKLAPQLCWTVPVKHNKVLYLTFDDGPTPEITDWVLDTLKAYKAEATFFCIGTNIETHPNIFQRILDEGHGIGNHTFQHLRGWNTPTDTYLKDTIKTADVIKEVANTKTSLFRPPHGRITKAQIRALQDLNYKIVMWSVLSKDWDAAIPKERCLDHVIKDSRSGDIIVFHDSIKASRNMQYALPKVLEYFSNEGYSFKRIPE